MNDPVIVALIALCSGAVGTVMTALTTQWVIPRFKVRQEVAGAAAAEANAETVQLDFYYKQIDRLQAQVAGLQTQVDTLRSQIEGLTMDRQKALTAQAAAEADRDALRAKVAQLTADQAQQQATIRHLSAMLTQQMTGGGPLPTAQGG